MTTKSRRPSNGSLRTAAARQRLEAEKPKNPGRVYGTIRQWLLDHPDADVLLQEWGRMKIAGETRLTCADVTAILKRDYDYPFAVNRNLLDYVRRGCKA